jgi:hypothetical protein
LYVALEGVAGFQKRVLAAKQVHGDPGKMFSRLVPHVSLNKAQAGAEGLSAVLKACEELSESAEEPVRLVVIDTQVRATAGDDENASADMMLYLEKRAGEIARKTGAAVLTLHHPNKGGDLRGSTAIPAGLDVILQIKGRSLVVEKNKDDVEGPMFDFELEPVTLACDARGRAITSCVVRASPPATSIPARPAKRSVDETRLIGIFLGHPGQRQVPVADVRAAYVRRRVDSEGAKLASANRAWRSLLARLPQDFSIEQDHSGSEIMLWHADPD